MGNREKRKVIRERKRVAYEPFMHMGTDIFFAYVSLKLHLLQVFKESNGHFYLP